MKPRFEIVRTDADQPWHARFIAANARVVWHTENYKQRRSVITAINAFAAPFYGNVMDDERGVTCRGTNGRAVIDIREIDERTQVDT